MSVIGAWLVKREGISLMRRVQRQVRDGQLPSNELVDGVLLLVAGAMMLAPGFITDAIAIMLLLPPTRAVVRTILRRRFRGRIVSIDERPQR